MPTVVMANPGQIYPTPIVGVPTRASAVPPQPGDVIIGYQLITPKAGMMDSFHDSYQVPVYGKPSEANAGVPHGVPGAPGAPPPGTYAAPQPDMMQQGPPGAYPGTYPAGNAYPTQGAPGGPPAGYPQAPAAYPQAPGTYPQAPAGGQSKQEGYGPPASAYPPAPAAPLNVEKPANTVATGYPAPRECRGVSYLNTVEPQPEPEEHLTAIVEDSQL